MNVRWAYASDQRLREENQDTFGVFEVGEVVVAVVCDGMGGHPGGRDASRIAVRAMHDTFTSSDAAIALADRLAEAVHRANAAVFRTARQTHRFGMGTTMVAAAIQGSTAVIAHVGDSRAYRASSGSVTRLTRDHTIVNLLIDAAILEGANAESHPQSHVLARSVGIDANVEVTVSLPIVLQPHEVLLLSSDGIHGVLKDEGLAAIDWSSPEAGVIAAIDRVRERNGDDNATIIAVGFGPTPSAFGTSEAPDIDLSLAARATQSSDAAPTESSPDRRLVPPQPIVTLPPTPPPAASRHARPTPAPVPSPAIPPESGVHPASIAIWVLIAVAVVTAWWWMSPRG